MKRTRTTLVTLAVTSALAAPAAFAQGSASPPGGATAPGTTASPGARAGQDGGATAGQLAKADRQFVMQAAMAGMAEVQAGEMASQKASSPQVRNFAQRMVEDHTKANQQLMKLAAARGVTPPDQLDREHRQAMERMQKLSGTEFDRAYMKQQVEDHQKAIAIYERQAKNGQDAELKQFASSQLPLLREHLQMARNDMKQIDAASGRGGAAGSASRTPGESMTGGAGGPGSSTAAGGASGGSMPPGTPGGAGGTGAGSGTSR